MWKDVDLVKIQSSSSWFVEICVHELGSPSWRGCFVYASCEDGVRRLQLKAACYHLPMVGADHCPLLLNTQVATEKPKRRDLDGIECVKKSSLSNLVFIKWCKLNNLNSRVPIDDLQGRIKAAYESECFDRDGMIGLEKELNKAWGEEEKYWFVKSKAKHLKEGDKKTPFSMPLHLLDERKTIFLGWRIMRDSGGRGRM
ncbi:hypothetical protein LIER_11011 [Lithospermum erythrorhizon]|uniref:Uncharacterized protein n=1 Tax=Lithospermum erythrorhizon TaxID=34254 RepID=A0AAV3PNH0_LITER